MGRPAGSSGAVFEAVFRAAGKYERGRKRLAAEAARHISAPLGSRGPPWTGGPRGAAFEAEKKETASLLHFFLL